MGMRVFDLVLDKAELIHQPQEVYRLRGWEGGLDVTPPTIGRVAFGDVAGLSVFRAVVRGDENIHLMIFLRDRPRPLDVAVDKIHYTDFPSLAQLPTGLEKLRKLVLLL